MHRFLLLIIIIALLPLTATAQYDQPLTWYFAYHDETGALIAFNTDGTVSTLLESGILNPTDNLTYLDHDVALAALNVDGTPRLYRLSPEKAELLEVDAGLAGNPLAVTTGAAVLSDFMRGEPVPAVLFTRDAVRELPQQVDGLRGSVRFSKDGQFLRYTGVDSSGTWGLWEHEVATGAERLIYTFGSERPDVRPDLGGEAWVWRLETAPQATYEYIHADGTVESLGTVEEGDLRGSFYPLGNSLIIYPPTCDETCTIEIRSTDATQLLQMNPAAYRALPISFTPDGGLIVVTQADEFFRLSQDAPPQLLGRFLTSATTPILSRFLSTSPDGRWLMVTPTAMGDDPTEFHLLDLTTGEHVRTFPIYNPALREIISGEGVLAFESDSRTEGGSYDLLLYTPESFEFITYTEADLSPGSYIALLLDQQAIYDGRDAIFKDDLRTGERTLLLEGKWRVMSFFTLYAR